MTVGWSANLSSCSSDDVALAVQADDMAAERMEKPGPYDPGFGIRSISAGLIAQLQVNTESARGLKITSQRSGERKRVGHVAILGQIPAPGS